MLPPDKGSILDRLAASEADASLLAWLQSYGVQGKNWAVFWPMVGPTRLFVAQVDLGGSHTIQEAIRAAMKRAAETGRIGN